MLDCRVIAYYLCGVGLGLCYEDNDPKGALPGVLCAPGHEDSAFHNEPLQIAEMLRDGGFALR